METLKVASLFCGCGGTDVGVLGGFDYLGKHYSSNNTEIVYANDIEQSACDLFEANFGIKPDNRDIRNVRSDELPEFDILTGGFPCQSFSIVAQNPKRLGIKDEKGMLFFEMCRILRDRQPKCFIAENVKGILTANKHEAFPLILKEFEDSGYNVKYKVLYAADFGVPQKRERVIIVGFRKDLNIDFEFPEVVIRNEKDYVPLAKCIDHNVPEKYYFSDKAVAGMMKNRESMNKGRIQDITKPCNTVGAHLAKVSLNSTDPVLFENGRFRRFTPREVARIQSFPENYNLILSDAIQYKALGNAIPPVMFWYVANKVSGYLFNEERYKTIDLFAGAGGLSYGFLSTGKFKIVSAAEINKDAKQTYIKNISKDDDFVMIDNVIGYDFSKLNDHFKGIDIVIGGPPCQGFSNANRNKNHLVSTNNSLVKEYFRAIKEIRPKAFIMENVSMLQSDKHRFFESLKDCEEIEKLKKSGFSIPQRRDVVFIASKQYEELSPANPSKSLDYLLPNDLLQLLNVLYKNISNERRLSNYLAKNKNRITKSILDYELTGNENNAGLVKKLRNISDSLDKGFIGNCLNDLSYVIGLQKAIGTIKEISDNQIIGEYYLNNDNELVFSVNSYSVIDYINAVLGGEYSQIGGTVCAEKFGVPQERRRFIVMGIRNDLCKEKILSMPEENSGEKVTTVMDAIGDLEKYIPSSTSIEYELKYEGDEKLSAYARKMRRMSRTIKNHIITKTTEKALSRYKLIKQGDNFHSLPLEQKDTYAKPERTQNTIYLRLDPNKPCGTVVNVRKSMWIHPNLDRAISVREAARLQSFPDVFEFVGTKDSQYQQVGNAVPPLMAEAIAKNLLKYL